MAESSTPFVAPAALRLTFCPRCDYSLEGLPAEGTCPECGAAYDRSCVVLRGKPLSGEAGDETTQGNLSVSNVLLAGVPLVLVALLLGHQRGTFEPVYIIWGTLAVAPFLMGAIARLSSPRPGYVLVWMSPDGIAQGSMAPPGSMANRFQQFMKTALVFAFPLYMIVPGSSRRGMSLVTCTIMAAIILSVLLVRLRRVRRRGRQLVPAHGDRPALLPWSAIKSVTFKPLKRGRFQLSVTRVDWVSKSMPVNVVLQITPQDTTTLGDCMASLRRGADITRRSTLATVADVQLNERPPAVDP